jgi:hypothetical protein
MVETCTKGVHLAMACRQPGSIQSVLRSSSRALIALALVAAPVAAGAARLSQVRVGTHEDHTRIVLELDAAASYRLAPPPVGGSQLQIQLDADSAARHVASKSPLVKAVRVEPSQQGSTISVDLAKGDVEISEMVLADPPRIVLDVKPAGSTAMAPPPAPKPAPAAAPAPAPSTAAAPAAPPTGESRLAADGRPVVATRPAAPTPAAPKAPTPSLGDPVPSDIVTKPAARFEPPVVKPAPVAKSETPASPEPAIVAKAESRIPAPPAVPSGASSSAAAASPTAAAPAPASPERVAPPAPPAAKPAEVVVRKATPPDAKPVAAAGPSWTERLTSPTGYAAIGAVLLAGVVLAVRRRRRDEDDDPLYSVMSAEDAGADAEDEDLRGQQSDPVVEWRREEEPEVESEYAPPQFDADEPVSRDGSQQLALGRLRASVEEPAPAADPDSLFDGPGAPLIATPPAPAISSAYASDASHLSGEIESRVKDLERRLEQLTEARERLERQVAAQTEELRVQRAAIARTQRVVRSMSKGEDLATEPVPRAPQA